MFRCITELKGFIIDIDSFEGVSLKEWDVFIDDFRCVFLTAKKDQAEKIRGVFRQTAVLLIEPFQMRFAPSIAIHKQCVKILGVESTETVYISKNIEFINNAMGFLTGTIWITESVNYEDASRIADLVSKDLRTVHNALTNGVKGFIGETVLFPGELNKGTIGKTSFLVDGITYSLIFLGRYFNYDHYMSQIHPYSSAISLNKRSGKKYYGAFDDVFSQLYLTALKRIMLSEKIDGICSTPPRVGAKNRFSRILQTSAKATGVKNYDGLLICGRPYSMQKSLSCIEREENIKGAFQATSILNGETMVLIDDVASTGSTLRECVRILKRSGVGKIIIIVLAINQIHESYWSSFSAQVSCPRCREKMHLLVNSNSKQFFYSCFRCKNQTMNFNEGRQRVITYVNREVAVSDDEIYL